jgi:hypothetical protein
LETFPGAERRFERSCPIVENATQLALEIVEVLVEILFTQSIT